MNDHWNIARALVAVSSSPEELLRFIKTLKSRTDLERVIILLERLTVIEPDPAPPEEHESKTSEHMSDIESYAQQLQDLFRGSLHFTTAEVEEWLRATSNVTQSVNKESLKTYLQRVLKKHRRGFADHLMNEVYKEVARTVPTRLCGRPSILLRPSDTMSHTPSNGRL
jgi:Asp-tRNA(Asn)/Glu-tRNA(Gln) amidotransferase C subunit